VFGENLLLPSPTHAGGCGVLSTKPVAASNGPATSKGDPEVTRLGQWVHDSRASGTLRSWSTSPTWQVERHVLVLIRRYNLNESFATLLAPIERFPETGSEIRCTPLADASAGDSTPKNTTPRPKQRPTQPEAITPPHQCSSHPSSSPFPSTSSTTTPCSTGADKGGNNNFLCCHSCDGPARRRPHFTFFGAQRGVDSADMCTD